MSATLVVHLQPGVPQTASGCCSAEEAGTMPNITTQQLHSRSSSKTERLHQQT